MPARAVAEPPLFFSAHRAGEHVGAPAARLKVLYILPPTKTYAGIERVIDEICSELALSHRGAVDVELLLTSRFLDAPVEQRNYVVIRREVRTRIGLLRAVRGAVTGKPYDLVIVPQVEATVLFWLASLGSKARFVLYLHGNPDLEQRSFKARILFWLMQHLVLHRVAGVFGTSPRQLEAFQRMFPSKAPHIWTPNPVRRFAHAERRDGPAGLVTFVNVGRFSYQKGHDILLRVFARLHCERPQARLRMVGYGEDEAALRAQIARLGLSDVAWIEHHPTDPAPALAASDVYVSTSRWEGWSLAICEALRFGLPVVAIDCAFGPSDILIDPRLGRLTPLRDDDALVAAMRSYCDAPEPQYAEYRKAHVDAFSVEKVAYAHAHALACLCRT